MSIAGVATAEGTDHYRKRFGDRIHRDHFRQAHGLWMSSIGIGTYLGNYDAETDRQYQQAITRAVQCGCNVIDSAINYRLQRSERAIGAALQELSTKGFDRSEIIVATKGGFIPYDGTPPDDVRSYIESTVLQPGLAGPEEIISGCHCLAPAYLLNQIDCSLRNLDAECIDIYYVHNPETQLGTIPREEFNGRLLKAFEALENAVAAGKIRMYGTATWNGYRNDPQAKDYLSLAEVAGLAAKAGGQDHHFKVIQLPFNLGMNEALSAANQTIDSRTVTVLEAAQALGITVMCSASILQGQLASNLPPMIGAALQGLETDSQRSIQFVRSTPGVTTALVGMKQIKHVEESLRTARFAPAPWEQYSKLFQSQGEGPA
jgi:aryl-alcohol dehydrogenase-like predicted oxidoreductase